MIRGSKQVFRVANGRVTDYTKSYDYIALTVPPSVINQIWLLSHPIPIEDLKHHFVAIEGTAPRE